MDLLMAENEFANSDRGFGLAIDPTVPASKTRIRVHIRDKIVTPFLKKPHGTLLVVMGLAIKDLKEALDGLDTFTGYEALSLAAGKPSDNDKLRMPAYLRFKTICGHPLHMKSLEQAHYITDEISKLQVQLVNIV